MKKLFLSFAMLFVCMIASAQFTSNLKLTADGTLTTEDAKDFVVVPFEGKSASDLYSQIKRNVMSVYNSPKDVMSEDENSSIAINAYAKEITYLKSMGMKIWFSANYNLKFQFKDGRIRISAPTITRWSADMNADIPFAGWLKAQNVFKKGEPNPKKQETIDLIQDYFNTLINNLVNGQSQKAEEDW